MRLTRSEILVIHNLYNLIGEQTDLYLKWEDLCTGMMLEPRITAGFKAIYGINLRRFHLEKSLIRAREYIREGKQVKAVSMMLGYQYVGNFSRAYKLFFGYAPLNDKYP